MARCAFEPPGASVWQGGWASPLVDGELRDAVSLVWRFSLSHPTRSQKQEIVIAPNWYVVGSK